MKLKYYLALVLMLLATPAKAELEINVAGAMRDPMPLAMPEMIHDGFFVGQYADKTAKSWWPIWNVRGCLRFCRKTAIFRNLLQWIRSRPL